MIVDCVHLWTLDGRTGRMHCARCGTTMHEFPPDPLAAVAALRRLDVPPHGAADALRWPVADAATVPEGER